MVSTRHNSSSAKLSTPSPVPSSKHLKAENSHPKEVPVAPRDDVLNSKELALSSSQYQLPSDPATGSVEDPATGSVEDPATGSVEDPAPAETPASNLDAFHRQTGRDATSFTRFVSRVLRVPLGENDDCENLLSLIFFRFAYPGLVGSAPTELEKLKTVPSTWNNRSKKRTPNLESLTAWRRLISQYPQRKPGNRMRLIVVVGSEYVGECFQCANSDQLVTSYIEALKHKLTKSALVTTKPLDLIHCHIYRVPAVAGASILASLSNLGNDLSLLPPPSQSNEDAQQAIGRPALSTAFELPDDSVPMLDINTCTRKDSADQNSGTDVPLDDNAPAPAEHTSSVDLNVGNIDRGMNADNGRWNFKSISHKKFMRMLKDTVDIDPGGSFFKQLREDRKEMFKDSESSTLLPMSAKCQAFKDNMREGILDGSDIYQETLAQALANFFGSKLLIVDANSLPNGLSAKDSDVNKDGVRVEKLSGSVKHRSSHSDAVQQKKPTSSVEADIVCSSAINSKSPPKQEASAASSKT
ncbi:uncharacterized protein LOC126410103 [Nymphaea colorata]|nr:uncharacterized protein LOC126410103 [Nymphaea colorata]